MTILERELLMMAARLESIWRVMEFAVRDAQVLTERLEALAKDPGDAGVR